MSLGLYNAGLPPRQSNSLQYIGENLSTVPVVNIPYAPTVNDGHYPLFTLWRNSNKQAVLPDAEGDLWYYAKVDLTVSPPQHIWLKIATGTSPGGSLIGLEDTLGVNVLPDGSGFIKLEGSSGITITSDPGNNKLTFAVGGSGAGLGAINVDASTPPGTDPVLPDGSNEMTFTGAQVAPGTIGANVIRTNSLAASNITYEIQQTSAVAAKDTTKNGVAHFDSTYFTNDEGFISANGLVKASLSPYIVGPTNSDYTTIQAAYNAGVAATSAGQAFMIYLKPKTSNYNENLVMTDNRIVGIVGFLPSVQSLADPSSPSNNSITIVGNHTVGGIQLWFSDLVMGATSGSLYTTSGGSPVISHYGVGTVLSNSTFLTMGASTSFQARFWNSQIDDSAGTPSSLFLDANLDASIGFVIFDFENSLVSLQTESTASKGLFQFRGLNCKIDMDMDLSGTSELQDFFMEHSNFIGDVSTAITGDYLGKFTYFDGAWGITSPSSYLYESCAFSSTSTFPTDQPILRDCQNVCGFTRVTMPAGDYVTTVMDNFIGADTSAVRTITLYADPFTDMTQIIKDITGTASTNNITIDGNGNTIDGQATYVMAGDYQSCKLVFNGNEWSII